MNRTIFRAVLVFVKPSAFHRRVVRLGQLLATQGLNAIAVLAVQADRPLGADSVRIHQQDSRHLLDALLGKLEMDPTTVHLVPCQAVPVFWLRRAYAA